jgi:tripartite-type tricarboxylate transporter receptor subunit TctC
LDISGTLDIRAAMNCKGFAMNSSMVMVTRRCVAVAALGAVLPTIGRAQTATVSGEAFPSRPVRLVVPTPPATALDIRGRQLAEKLSEEWQQNVFVDNRPGASEKLALDFVAQAPPDGHTMLLGGFGMVTVAHLIKLPYDPLKAFVAITKVSAGPLILLAYPGVPFNSIAELVAYARANPRKLNVATGGVGNIQHLASALFSKAVGVEFTHVPYKGGSQLMTDLIAGEVQLSFNVASVALPLLKSGRIKALAVAAQNRLAVLREVPTFNELGHLSVDVNGWMGIFVRAGTSGEIVAKMNKSIVRALNLPDIRQSIIETGGVVGGDSPEQFAAFVQSESAKWGNVIAEAGIRLE